MKYASGPFTNKITQKIPIRKIRVHYSELYGGWNLEIKSKRFQFFWYVVYTYLTEEEARIAANRVIFDGVIEETYEIDSFNYRRARSYNL